MPRKPSSRVVLNRSRMTDVGLAVADGLMEVGRTIIETAEPPDATPFGQGLVTRGGVLVYWDAKKLDGWGQDGRQPKKPQAFRVRGSGTIQAIAGWGFPARFQEFGTIHHGAQPFFTPAVNRVLPQAQEIFRSVVGPRLGRIP